MTNHNNSAKFRILFVCLGNICRSPAAETIFAQLAAQSQLDVEADSAGISNWHEGEQADQRMRNVAEKHGYRISSISRPFSRHDFDRFDLIVAMDNQNRSDILKAARNKADEEKVLRMADFLSKSRYDHIPDPYYGDAAAFSEVVELLEDSSQGLIRYLKKNFNL